MPSAAAQQCAPRHTGVQLSSKTVAQVEIHATIDECEPPLLQLLFSRWVLALLMPTFI